MVLQVITPEKENFELPVSLPKSYLGKEVHCLFFIEEEQFSERCLIGDFFLIRANAGKAKKATWKIVYDKVSENAESIADSELLISNLKGKFRF